MKPVTQTAEVSKAYGEDVNPALRFTFSYEELEKGDEIPAKETLDDEDIRNFVNARRKASARSSAQNETLRAAGIKAPTLEDPEVQVKTIVRALVAAGNSQEDAEKMARQLLGK